MPIEEAQEVADMVFDPVHRVVIGVRDLEELLIRATRTRDDPMGVPDGHDPVGITMDQQHRAGDPGDGVHRRNGVEAVTDEPFHIANDEHRNQSR